jgi:hypothetical protein
MKSTPRHQISVGVDPVDAPDIAPIIEHEVVWSPQPEE